jgi:hypothetical protein
MAVKLSHMPNSLIYIDYTEGSRDVSSDYRTLLPWFQIHPNRPKVNYYTVEKRNAGTIYHKMGKCLGGISTLFRFIYSKFSIAFIPIAAAPVQSTDDFIAYTALYHSIHISK